MPLELEEEQSSKQGTLHSPVGRASDGRKPAGVVKRMRKLKAVLAASGVLAIFAAGTGAYLHFQNRVSTDDAQVDAHNASIAAKISGNLVEISVDDNQMVKAGQVLVRIDPRD